MDALLVWKFFLYGHSYIMDVLLYEHFSMNSEFNTMNVPLYSQCLLLSCSVKLHNSIVYFEMYGRFLTINAFLDTLLV